jgi:hypothetical protein
MVAVTNQKILKGRYSNCCDAKIMTSGTQGGGFLCLKCNQQVFGTHSKKKNFKLINK